MSVNFANEATTTLDGSLTDSATSLSVADATGFPDVPFIVRVDDEFIRVTAVGGTGDVDWTVERGIEGSTAAAHDSGADVTNVVTAGALNDMRDDVDAVRENYTIAVIPDTQNLSNSGTNIAHFQALADYLTANADSLNLQLIVHVGDVVSNPTTTEYDRADGPMQDIRDIGIPFLAAIGNHDYATNFDDHDATTIWNTYFGPSFYGSPDWLGDVMTSGESENMYITPIIGGRPTLVLSLETFPRQATMEWADGVVADHPYHDVIVVTHSFMFIDGTRTEDGDAHAPDAYSVTGTHSGEQMWQDHLKSWRNLKLVVSGHHLSGNLATRTDYGDNGNAVWQQFQNWQQDDQGGDGRVVLLTVNPQTGAAFRRVYNPRQSAWDTTAGNELAFTLDRQQIAINQLDTRYINETAMPIRGTAVIVNPDTTKDVEHTSDSTPTPGEIQVTPASSLYDAAEYWLSDLGVSTFRINLDAAPGTGNSVAFHWLYQQAEPGDLTIEAFTADGTWDWSAAGSPSTVEALVVAGGGGGGGYFSGGGGGAGGVLYDAAFAVNGNVSVVIGAGGDGGTASRTVSPFGEDGQNSSFGALTAIGGGGGGGVTDSPSNAGPGRAGGSGGGGGGRLDSTGGSGEAGQGYAGGKARPSNFGGTGGGGGGGGADEVGEGIGPENRGGAGGDGRFFSQFSSYGDNGYFGGGGGGGTITSSSPGTGGDGGGGAGNAGVSADGFHATANTGGGGGGAGNDGTDSGAGGNGADGIVLVRYLTP